MLESIVQTIYVNLPPKLIPYVNLGDYFHIVCMVWLSRKYILSFKSFKKQFLILPFYHVLVWNRPMVAPIGEHAHLSAILANFLTIGLQ